MSFWRLIDFLKRFVAANQSLIKDHQQKLKAKKKTRRYQLPQEFMRLTEIMENMLNVFTKVNLKPAATNMKLNMKFYYTELTDFDRLTYDTVDITQSLTPDRMFPIASTDEDRKSLQEFIKLAQDWR